MSYLSTKSKLLITSLATAVLLWTPSLMADTLSVNIGFWPGDLEPELEERYFLDDLVNGITLDRIDLEWSGKNTNTIYPLGLEYRKQIGPGDLMLRGNYTQYNPEYKYNAITMPSAVTIGSLLDYSINDTEFEAGYRFHLLGNTLFLTPKAGYRRHSKAFFRDEFTIGTGTYGKTIDSNFNASTSGLYAGFDFQYYFTKEFSVVGSYILASGAWSGTATQDLINASISTTTGTSFTYESATSGYELSIARWNLGLQYDLDKNWHFQIGLREEVLTQSYPGYINLAFGTGGAPYTVNEILTDYIFYSQEIDQTKGLAYFAISY
ncbi:MAG: hypothetical protein KDK39_12335, partial [Leptospiraceae bacterium]|nr:hypothetical protein [Leptospiraceae bacterium]